MKGGVCAESRRRSLATKRSRPRRRRTRACSPRTDTCVRTPHTRERTSGSKNGLLFVRVYGYEDTPAGGAQHLYRYECLRLRGLDLLPVAYGRTNDDARENLYEDLKRKGVMPPTEIE
jgi:hypothetical protein